MFDGKKIDYKSSGKTKPLEIPPDLAAPSANSRFQVPDAGGASAATYSEYEQQRAGKPVAPATSDVLPTFEKARFERGGSQRWLVAQGDAGTALAGREGVLAGERIPDRIGEARHRHHGNRLGGEPGEDSHRRARRA